MPFVWTALLPTVVSLHGNSGALGSGSRRNGPPPPASPRPRTSPSLQSSSRPKPARALTRSIAARSSQPRSPTAVRGVRDRSAVISRRARPSAKLSRYCPPAYISATTAAARYSPNHRQCCDDVEADVAAAQAGDDLGNQYHKHQPRAGSPDESRPRAVPDCSKSKSEREQSRCRKRNQERPQEKARWCVHFMNAIAIMARQVANPAAGTQTGTLTCGPGERTRR
jgi:hypothetical protein